MATTTHQGTPRAPYQSMYDDAQILGVPQWAGNPAQPPRTVPTYDIPGIGHLKAEVTVTSDYCLGAAGTQGNDAITRLRILYGHGTTAEFTRNHVDGEISIKATNRNNVDLSNNRNSISKLLQHTQTILTQHDFAAQTQGQFTCGNPEKAIGDFLQQLQRQYPDLYRAAPQRTEQVRSTAPTPTIG